MSATSFLWACAVVSFAALPTTVPPALQFDTSAAAVGPTWMLVRAHAASVQPALAAVTSSAENALRGRAFSVVNCTHLPPSGDVHDYQSVGVYWWPCSAQGPQSCSCDAAGICTTRAPSCDTKTQLPWVSCDGHMNHAAVNEYDEPMVAGLAAAVQSLSQGFYWTRDERYAARAVELVRTWFITPATRMAPNLFFGQRFPGAPDGESNGTFSGLIEIDGNLINILDGVSLLAATAPCSVNGTCNASAAWTQDDTAGLLTWLSEWSSWLSTSPFAAQATTFFNKCGGWG